MANDEWQFCFSVLYLDGSHLRHVSYQTEISFGCACNALVTLAEASEVTGGLRFNCSHCHRKFFAYQGIRAFLGGEIHEIR